MTIFGTLWPKQNHPVIWLRHNGRKQTPCDSSIDVLFGYVGNGPFPKIFTQNHYFCFYFLTLAFYFVPSLGKNKNKTKNRKLKNRFSHKSEWPITPNKQLTRFGLANLFTTFRLIAAHCSACKTENSWSTRITTNTFFCRTIVDWTVAHLSAFPFKLRRLLMVTHRLVTVGN